MRLQNLVLGLLLLAPPLSAQSPTDAPELRLRPGDAVRLHVAFRGQSNPAGGLNADYPVLEQGVALFPVIGDVRVAGRPFEEVRVEIRDRLAAELVGASVLVVPVLRIAVLGEVMRPGLVSADPTFRVADVVAAAGGLSPRADPARVTLVRGDGPVELSLEVGEAGGGQRLRSGDQIVVGRQGWFRENLNLLLPSAASVLAATITTLILRR